MYCNKLGIHGIVSESLQCPISKLNNEKNAKYADDHLIDTLLRAMDFARERVSLSWLTAFPISDHIAVAEPWHPCVMVVPHPKSLTNVIAEGG